jgi:hypothetical protein
MDLLREAGIFGPLSVLLFLSGLTVTLTLGRARGAVVATATPFILAILAAGQLGHGLGQRLVRDAIEKVPELAQKVSFLNIGTGEAAANLVVSGAAAFLLCVVAGLVGLADKKQA